MHLKIYPESGTVQTMHVFICMYLFSLYSVPPYREKLGISPPQPKQEKPGNTALCPIYPLEINVHISQGFQDSRRTPYIGAGEALRKHVGEEESKPLVIPSNLLQPILDKQDFDEACEALPRDLGRPTPPGRGLQNPGLPGSIGSCERKSPNSFCPTRRRRTFALPR